MAASTRIKINFLKTCEDGKFRTNQCIVCVVWRCDTRNVALLFVGRNGWKSWNNFWQFQIQKRTTSKPCLLSIGSSRVNKFIWFHLIEIISEKHLLHFLYKLLKSSALICTRFFRFSHVFYSLLESVVFSFSCLHRQHGTHHDFRLTIER